MREEFKMKSIHSLVDNIPLLNSRWADRIDEIECPADSGKLQHWLHREYNFKTVQHKIKFHDTGYVNKEPLRILFFSFSTLMYELEGLELPLYASKVFPNATIDMCYIDGRGNVDLDNRGKVYILSVFDGKITKPKNDFLKEYDFVVTRSSSLNQMRSRFPDLYKNCGYKINLQTNNFAPNFNIGEDYNFSHTDFYAPGGRVYQDRSKEITEDFDFQKYNIIAMSGTIFWWKGQVEWLTSIDPELLQNYLLVSFGKIMDESYFYKFLNVVRERDINFAYTGFVDPNFVCDVLSFSKISIMNHYATSSEQPVIGPARTFGESLVCSNICLHGQTYSESLPEGKTAIIPDAWSEYTVEYDQNSSIDINRSFLEAEEKVTAVDFSNLESIEVKMDNILQRCFTLWAENLK